MYTQRRSNPRAWRALLVLILGTFAGAALADADPPDRVARLSYLRGNVSFQTAGDDQWSEASLNRPLGTGDKVYTDRDSRAELEIGAANIRLDQGSTFNLLNLDSNTAQIELTEGTLNLHVRRVFDGQSYEVDTPTLAFVVNQPGDYRIDIAPQGDSTMVTVFDGAGDVYGENNASYSVRSGNSYKFSDSALRDYEVLDLPRRDDFDQWCSTRNQRYERAASRQYVSEDVIGYADLDDYGGWRDEPEYGHVWYPTTVEAGWAPYRSGNWSWIDPWGWTWVDSSPWGFAPFHYGRWSYIGNRWGWCPGAPRLRPVYAPALVAFVGGNGWGSGISVGIGGGPVGWFPLGPRDVYVPWYRASRSYFTNVNVRNTTIINNTYITNVYNNYSRGRPITGVNYAYRTNAAAVTAVSREAFVGSRGVAASRVQINEANLRNAQVVSRVGIAPERASFVANTGRGRAAPQAATLDRRVIARTAPPAQVAPIASRIQAIQRNGAQPLATSQLRQTAARPAANAPQMGRAPASRVQVVGQNNAAKPQPLPMRGAAAAAQQRPGIGNDRAAPAGSRGPAPANQTGPANRGSIAAPGNTAPNAAAQRQQVGTPDRNALPSSRFAPRAGGPGAANPTDSGNRSPAARGNSPSVATPNRSVTNPSSRGSSTAPADRNPGGRIDTPARGSSLPSERFVPRNNAQTPSAAQRQQLPQQRANPSVDRGNATAPQGQIRPAPQIREIPRNNAPAQQQPRVEQRSAPQPQYQPRNTPQQQPRVEQPQRSAPQPRSVPQQQPQMQPRSAPAPQQQQQRAQPQERRAPVERQERGKDKDKDKDKDGR